ncbi:MAG TPA: transcriptional repressor NrdR [Planctomycetaceae bacterium]|nr:transcriptional repressor NrdR [Planctomycetaceae bacterium]
MRCPFCQQDHDRVIDSRVCEDGMAIRRRRQCINCEMRYTTYERVGDFTFKVVKRDGTREPYLREKLRRGVAVACSKRPISDEQIEKLVGEVEYQVLRECVSEEVESLRLGQLVLEHLQQLDKVAYVRFASVYLNFDEVRDFFDEISPLLERERSAEEV